MKVGREATIFHIKDGEQTYVIIDAPYIDCGNPKDYRYTAGICRCDACTDEHAARAARRLRAHSAAKRRREEAQATGRLSKTNVWHRYRDV